MTAPNHAATRLRLAPVAALATLLALFATVLVAPTLGGGGARAMGTLPACRYDDILTSPRGYGDWSTTLVDTILRVPKTYVPPDLVPVSDAGLGGSMTVRLIMIDDLRAMADAATAAGAPLGVDSAYRSYAEQKVVFDRWVAQLGYAKALTVSARQGHSEHQLGLAIDFKSKNDGSPFNGDWGTTPAGIWMAAHAWEYGFVMSYPKGDSKLTCYAYEPWHFRYVGRDLAAKIHASGLTSREYLWANFTTTIVPPPKTAPRPTIAPVATVVPVPTATAIPSPSATAPPASLPPAPGTLPALAPTGTPAAIPTPAAGTEPIDPAVAAGALPALVGVAGLAFALILGTLWVAGRRRRPGGSQPG